MHFDHTLVDKTLIKNLSRRDNLFSTFKVFTYIFAISLSIVIYFAYADNLLISLLCIIALGILYMHGVELQHEALHGNLFKHPALNKLVGRLTGLPMMISFTHYQSYHFHHHKCVGTSRDQELFNYTARSLSNPISMLVRVWNLLRLPSFLVTFLEMLQGDYPDKVKPSDRKALLLEYIVMFSLLCFALSSPFYLDNSIYFIWIIPWLAVAEPLHFLAEIPEHVGCSRQTRSILSNTRSYKTNPVWAYLINFNNFHIEHHLFPSVPAHRLSCLHDHVINGGGHCAAGYGNALLEVYATVHENREI